MASSREASTLWTRYLGDKLVIVEF